MGVAVLAAIFLSNLPEALSSTTGMRMTGQRTGRVLTTWAVVVVVSAISAALGYGLLDGASGNAIGLIQAFAGGAVLTMLVDTMIPEAFARGHRAVGLHGARLRARVPAVDAGVSCYRTERKFSISQGVTWTR